MEKPIIILWEKNKLSLRHGLELIMKSRVPLYYDNLLKCIVIYILNGGVSCRYQEIFWKGGKSPQLLSAIDKDMLWDDQRIQVIDCSDQYGAGDYIYYIMKVCWQKRMYGKGRGNVLTTHADYGTCSGCDTLLAIGSRLEQYWKEKENCREQIFWQALDDYMAASLHMVQRMKFVNNEEIEENDELAAKEGNDLSFPFRCHCLRKFGRFFSCNA